MKEEPAPDNDVEASHRSPSPSAPELADVVETPVPPRRRRKRRAVWPILLTLVLAGSAWTIAQSATLPPLPAVDANADAAEADSGDDAGALAVLPVAAPSPGPSAAAAPFGPQIQVILPPPPPPPPAASGGSRSRAKTVTPGMTYTEFCRGGVTATANPGSITGLLDAANSERARLGIAPLIWSGSLADQAQAWSQQMANDQSAHAEFNLATQAGFDAVSAQKGDPASAWRTQVFRHSGKGAENIAFSTNGSPSVFHTGWMKSEGHCKGIMNPAHTYMGAGAATSADGAEFATERFSG